MPQLTPIELKDGTIIYIEATEIETTENVDSPQNFDEYNEERGTRSGTVESAVAGLNNIKDTIRSFTNTTLGAFKEISDANIDKVTLEFGVKIAGKAGIPCVTEGSAESHVKITVECSFPKEEGIS